MKLFVLLLGLIIINAQELKKEFSLIGNDDYYFNRIKDCKVIKNKIYVLDSKNYCFFIFDDKGKFIKSKVEKSLGYLNKKKPCNARLFNKYY